MLRKTLFTLVLGALLGPLNASAQDEWEQQVLDILAEVSTVATDNGYRQTGDRFVSALDAGVTADHYVELMDGRDYVLVAVCDVDCSDIDLHLYGSNDQLVGSDQEPDDVPVIELNDVAGGVHRLEVGMYACVTEPCYYAVGVYVRTGQSSGGAPGAGGADAYVEQVVTLLESVSGVARDNGYTPTGQEWIDALDAGENQDIQVSLGGGADYIFVGVCDVDCDDIDLGIYNSAGSLVDEDVQSDATPVLELSGVTGGQYRLQVRMYQCSSEPCFYGVRLYKRTGQLLTPVPQGSEDRRW